MLKTSDYKKLDNPVWFSLSESHQDFSINYGNVKFYHPDYCPFGGIEIARDISKYLDEYSKLSDSFFIVGERPNVSPQQYLMKELVCLQMIIDKKIDGEIKETIIALSEQHADSLFQLVNLVQPGYFKNKTFLLGDYFGIFKDDELIAVAGERMRMNDYVEVSAIVTHPGHTGQGYAQQLIAHTVNKIFNQNKMPFLHVVETNIKAIRLYEKLGFKTRRQISFWNIGTIS